MISKVKFTDGLFLLKGVLSHQECEHYVARAESIGFESAPITTARGFEHRPEIRNNERVIVDDPQVTTALWERVSPFVPGILNGRPAVGLNERIRYYKYGPGQRFALHSDGYFRRENGERSLLTFMVYLGEEFSGGETIFEMTTIRPKAGMALVFRHELLHEGAAVRRGLKYVLRTDVMYGPPSS
jgi:prolyl 4-hydroxylase